MPHVVRRLVTEDIRLALPLAAPVEALALVLADIAARTLIRAAEAGHRSDDRPGGRAVVYLYRREVFK